MSEKTKFARRSFGQPYKCLNPWPEDCFVQCGDSGIVSTKGKSYTTAFFEAFPKEPKTFIRGQGETVEEAEKSAWASFEKYRACDHPDFERRGYTNGAAFCVKCGMFSGKKFEPTTLCSVCGKPTNYGHDSKTKEWRCEEHYEPEPWELDMKERLTKMTDADMTSALEKVIKGLGALADEAEKEGKCDTNK